MAEPKEVPETLRVRPGHHQVLRSLSPDRPFMAAFEDDGKKGVFYALDLRREVGKQIVDAVQVYTAKSEYGGGAEGTLRILWSPDGWKSALELEGNLHAAFDFVGCIGATMYGASPPRDGWQRIRARSAEEIRELFEA